MAYHSVLRRNRQNRTNYRKRGALLLGRRFFVSVTISNQNVIAQVLKPSSIGDRVVTAVQSRQLMKYGWKGSMNSLPSCYLTGFLLGFKSLEKGTDNLILYTGNKSYTSGIAACTKGLIDAGVHVPVSGSSLPSDERIRGSHIAQYAEMLKKDNVKYNLQFSNLLKNGCKPENYPDHFEAIKAKIRNAELAQPSSENLATSNKRNEVG
jgi:large subunit ribosomal protein L18